MLDVEVGNIQTADRFAKGDGDRGALTHRQRRIRHHDSGCGTQGVDRVVVRICRSRAAVTRCVHIAGVVQRNHIGGIGNAGRRRQGRRPGEAVIAGRKIAQCSMLDVEVGNIQTADCFAKGDGDRAGLAHCQRRIRHHNGGRRALGIDGVVVRVRRARAGVTRRIRIAAIAQRDQIAGVGDADCRRQSRRPGDATIEGRQIAQCSVLDSEVGQIQAGHGLTEGDGHQRRLNHAQSIVGHHDGGRRAHRVDDHARRCAQAVQSQSQVVAGGITDRAAIEVEAGADADAVCIVVTSLHCVLEDQGRAVAAARHQGGVTGGATDIQHQAWRTADQQALAGMDAKAQYIASLVAAIGRRHHAADRRCHGIDQHAIGRRQTIEDELCIVADAVAQGRTIELDVVANGNAVGIQLARGDGQAEQQRVGTGTGNVIRPGDLAVAQGHFQARRACAGVQLHVLAQVHGEVEVLPGDIGAVGRHVDGGHARRIAVDAVAHAHAPARDLVAGGIGDIGARPEVQAHGTGAGQSADFHGKGMAVDSNDVHDTAGDAAAEDQVEVAGIDVADVLAEGHGVADRAAVGRRGIDAGDVGGIRRRGVHQHVAGVTHGAEVEVQGVAGRVVDMAAVEVKGAVDADAAGGSVARLHGVLEH